MDKTNATTPDVTLAERTQRLADLDAVNQALIRQCRSLDAHDIDAFLAQFDREFSYRYDGFVVTDREKLSKEDPPTFFEIMTALAFTYFADRQIEDGQHLGHLLLGENLRRLGFQLAQRSTGVIEQIQHKCRVDLALVLDDRRVGVVTGQQRIAHAGLTRRLPERMARRHARHHEDRPTRTENQGLGSGHDARSERMPHG